MAEMLSKYDPVLKEHLIRLKQIACNPEASDGEEKKNGKCVYKHPNKLCEGTVCRGYKT